MTASLPAEITPQLSQARAVLERHLADNLQAIHLFGSAVDGGLKPLSDIDLMVTVNNALTDPVRRSLMMDLLSVSAAPGVDGPWRPLEVTLVVQSEVVPWRYPPLRELQFGEWLREELQAGIISPAVPDHDLAILLTKVRQHSVCVAGAPAVELFDPVPEADFSQALLDTVAQWNDEPDWQGDERNVVLALARIWFSAATGEITSKNAAAEWVLERLPDEHRPVLATAYAAYLGCAEDDLAHRAMEVAAFVRYARAMVERVCAARWFEQKTEISSRGSRTMLFGRKDHFAIEAMVEPDLVVPSAAWGRMRVWASGFSIGDYANPRCGLPRDEFEQLAINLPALWNREFDGMADVELFDYLDRLLYGCRRGAELFDDRTLPQLSEDERLYGKFSFLINWGEMFDNSGKSFIFCPDGRTVKVLHQPLRSEQYISLEAPLEAVREACHKFVGWFDQQVLRLAQRAGRGR
ncbi:AadA family aminoglycoside 3''-O-nucleotidyltransferase [Variovorax paradoxus]|uniref:Aminoglycoside (3'') (9) adenylyltransferase n=1 Tax=Variovorax paradoxus TaxID=34073 RepID=A0A6I6HG79_VARPD|nr:AadA family aminoglycoside 3''-O-nucleotidyltransferase [Variovorax paradoxus]